MRKRGRDIVRKRGREVEMKGGRKREKQSYLSKDGKIRIDASPEVSIFLRAAGAISSSLSLPEAVDNAMKKNY